MKVDVVDTEILYVGEGDNVRFIYNDEPRFGLVSHLDEDYLTVYGAKGYQSYAYDRIEALTDVSLTQVPV